MNDNVINNWDEITEWKNREITNFSCTPNGRIGEGTILPQNK